MREKKKAAKETAAEPAVAEVETEGTQPAGDAAEAAESQPTDEEPRDATTERAEEPTETGDEVPPASGESEAVAETPETGEDADSAAAVPEEPEAPVADTDEAPATTGEPDVSDEPMAEADEESEGRAERGDAAEAAAQGEVSAPDEPAGPESTGSEAVVEPDAEPEAEPGAEATSPAASKDAAEAEPAPDDEREPDAEDDEKTGSEKTGSQKTGSEETAAADTGPATDPATDPEPEDEPEQLVGRARLLDALSHFRRGQVGVALLLCLLGYAAVVQVQLNTEDSTYASLREQELIDILSGLAGTSQKAQEQIEDLEATREELEDQTLQQQTALQRAEEQVDTLRVIAGTVPVSGPGITVEIDPGPESLRLTALLDLIEELRTSGAEAMEIEGADGEAVRLVASSSIEVSQPAPGLNVGGELISPPYRLEVIGPPDTLAGAIDFYQGPQDQLEKQGAEVTVETEEKIDIESIHTVSR